MFEILYNSPPLSPIKRSPNSALPQTPGTDDDSFTTQLEKEAINGLLGVGSRPLHYTETTIISYRSKTPNSSDPFNKIF